MGFSTESRRTILARDGGCTVRLLLGGDCDGALHCHHIIPEAEAPHLADNPDNGIAVCAVHHPQLEKVARALRLHRQVVLPPCAHRHPYREGRVQCERRRRERLLARAA